MVTISWSLTTVAFAASAHASGTGRIDKANAGLIRRTATPLSGFDATTFAVTLRAGVSCTSTDAALPITRWFDAMSPSASTTNPDACVVWSPEGDDAVLPLTEQRRHAHLDRRLGGRSPGGEGPNLGVACGQLEHRVPARDDVDNLAPFERLAIERERLVRLHGVVPRSQPHVGGAVDARHDAARGRSGRVVADEERVARHGQRLLLRVQHGDFYVKNGVGGLERSKAWHGCEERGEHQRAEHRGSSSPRGRANVNVVMPSGHRIQPYERPAIIVITARPFWVRCFQDQYLAPLQMRPVCSSQVSSSRWPFRDI